MPEATSLLLAGGIFNLAFAAFHLFFWRLFAWKTELAKLSFINRAIVQVLNLCLTFAFGIFSYVSFMHPYELVTTALGHSILALVSLFWFFRAVYQVVFFKLRHWVSWVFFCAFLGGSSLYAATLAIAP